MMIVDLTRLPNPVEFDGVRASLKEDIEHKKRTRKSISEIFDFRDAFSLVRVVRLERTVSWSQTRRDTNFAIPGYIALL